MYCFATELCHLLMSFRCGRQGLKQKYGNWALKPAHTRSRCEKHWEYLLCRAREAVLIPCSTAAAQNCRNFR